MRKILPSPPFYLLITIACKRQKMCRSFVTNPPVSYTIAVMK